MRVRRLASVTDCQQGGPFGTTYFYRVLGN